MLTVLLACCPSCQVTDATPEEAIRGFRVERKETRELVFDTPGDYMVPELAHAAAGVQPSSSAQDSSCIGMAGQADVQHQLAAGGSVASSVQPAMAVVEAAAAAGQSSGSRSSNSVAAGSSFLGVADADIF